MPFADSACDAAINALPSADWYAVPGPTLVVDVEFVVLIAGEGGNDSGGFGDVNEIDLRPVDLTYGPLDGVDDLGGVAAR